MEKQLGEIQYRTEYLELLIHFKNLFERPNIRKNIYLYNQIKSNNLVIPFFVLAEERKVLQIIHHEKTIKQALLSSQYVEFNPKTRLVQIVQFPCLKIKNQSKNQLVFRKLEEYVENSILPQCHQQELQGETEAQNIERGYSIEFIISKHQNEDGYYYFIMKPSAKMYKNSKTYRKGVGFLEKVVDSFNQNLHVDDQIKYVNQPFYEDIKEGIAHAKKIKKQIINRQKNMGDPNRGGNSLSQTSNLLNENYMKYNRMNPLPIFVRKAIHSEQSDSEEEPEVKVEEHPSEYNQKIVQTKQQSLQGEEKSFKGSQNKNKKKVYHEKEFRDKNQRGNKRGNKKNSAYQSKAPQVKDNKPLFDDKDFPSIG